MRSKPRGAADYGVDLGKNLFHIVGADAEGRRVQTLKCRRNTLLTIFIRADPALVGMGACPGPQWLARKWIASGDGLG